MNALLNYAAVLAVMSTAARAHMSLWHPSMYGYSQSYQPVTPLAGQSFNNWWFHGYLDDKPKEVMTITPGEALTVEIACSKQFTTYGSSPSSDACPSDSGAYHAGGTSGSSSGWAGNNDDALLGCALAIAYKSDANQVQPEDFTVMSVQERCVRQRDTTFEIPVNMPACPDGECVCAWFWQGKNSALEMYMTGFRCTVQGGVETTEYPQPVKPRRGQITGATQPMYWGNDRSNLGYTPEWATKPAYNSAWGWSDGAQTSAFSSISGGAGGGGSGGSSDGSANSTSFSMSSGSQATSSAGSRPSPSASQADYEDASASTTSASPSSTSRRGGDGHQSSTSTAVADGQPETKWYQHNAEATGSAGGSSSKQCKRSSKSKRHARHRRRSAHTKRKAHH